MSELENKEKDASTNPENTVLVQGEENTNSETKDETQKVSNDTAKAKSTGGKSTKGAKTAKVDSKNKATGTSTKEGDQPGGKVNKGDQSDKAPKTAKPSGKTDQRDKVATDVFKNNPNCTKLFFTSDDIPFFAESDALKHARSLDDQTVVPKYKE